jgi:glutamate-5-semialdehyde dehydrogenase
MDTTRLQRLEPGMPIVYGGDRVTHVDEDLAAAFAPGDALVVLQDRGDLLHVPRADREAAQAAVTAAADAFDHMGSVDDQDLDRFYEAFARRLEDDDVFAPIAAANEADVAAARGRGRSVTRLTLDARMRSDMVAGLRGWRGRSSARGQVLETIEHAGWRLEQVTDRLGVIAFVFEGRPNVFADACGVLRGGNTVVFRIGSDALGTARAIVEHALDPALSEAGLPAGAAALVDAPSRASGWALFSDRRLALAVARGSGEAVRQLGAVASQAGNDVSLHGTGGAWLVGSEQADTERFRAAVHRSLDRKVCNTLNTCLVPAAAADRLVPAFLEGLERAASDRGTNAKLHVLAAGPQPVPEDWFERRVKISRADGEREEPQAEPLDEEGLATEWEWEDSPEVTLAVVGDLDEAVALFNRHSPHFVISLVSEDDEEHERVFAAADAPYVGNGFTRWVDGQYALGRPELGLSNWERGRLFARSGILSGDAIFTVRSRAHQDEVDLHR